MYDSDFEKYLREFTPTKTRNILDIAADIVREREEMLEAAQASYMNFAGGLDPDDWASLMDMDSL